MIIHTMIFAYAFLGVTQFRDDAVSILHSVDTIIVPDSLRAELTNVVWQWVQYKNVNKDLAMSVLHDTESLIYSVIPTDHICERALELAVEAKHSAYDTLFVAAAEITDTKLITFDQKLATTFPNQTLTAAQFLIDHLE